MAYARMKIDSLELSVTGPSVSKKNGALKKQKIPAATETQECRIFVDWSKLVLYLREPLWDRVVKIPNERGKNGVQTAILVGLGMKSGVQDYIILAPGPSPLGGVYGGFLMESKTRDGGRVDVEQLAWQDRGRRYGYHTAICNGGLEMIAATRDYFELIGSVRNGDFQDRTRI